jgi:hypothetical protein
LSCGYGDEAVFFGRNARPDLGAALSAREVAACIGEEGVYLTALLSPRVGRVYESL